MVHPAMEKYLDYVQWTDMLGNVHQSKGIVGGTASTAIYLAKIAAGAKKASLHMYGSAHHIRSYNKPSVISL